MQRFTTKKLTFENIAAMVAETEVDKKLESASEAEVSAVKDCFNDVWAGLRKEYTTAQLRNPDSTDLPRIKSNIRKTINLSNLSHSYKKLLIQDIDEASSPIELLDKITRYLLEY